MDVERPRPRKDRGGLSRKARRQDQEAGLRSGHTEVGSSGHPDSTCFWEFPAVQGLGPRPSKAAGLALIPGQGAKIPQATRRCQKKKKIPSALPLAWTQGQVSGVQTLIKTPALGQLHARR